MRLDISNDNITIKSSGYYEIYGSSSENNIYVDAKATIILENIDINLKEQSKPAIKLSEDSDVNLIIRGINNLKSGDNYAGIEMNKKCRLTIEGENNSAILNIESGTSGAGIGSGFNEDYWGDIIINSGNINIVSTREGAGIGGGNGGNGGGNFLGSLVVEGGVITISIGFAGGAGIGGGANGNLEGHIKINNGSIYVKESNDGIGAGIGGGYDANLVGDVVINGGLVKVFGGRGAAGIGGGLGVKYGGDLTGKVVINGGEISAFGGIYEEELAGSGIGGGYNGNLGGTVSLNFGNITAHGPGSANDIGAGSNGAVTGNVDVKIDRIEINPTYMNLDIGESKKINTTVLLAPEINARISDYEKVTYVSENIDIATVNEDGLVTSIGKGSTNIVVRCDIDKSKTAICKITVNEEIINIGEIDLLIKVDKKMLKEEDIPNIVCYGNNPVIVDSKINSEVKELESNIYISKCDDYVHANIEYKKLHVYLEVAYSIVLFTTDTCLDKMKIYAMENTSNLSYVSFCLNKEQQIDISNFIITLDPKYEIDKDYSERYYLFKILGNIYLKI